MPISKKEKLKLKIQRLDTKCVAYEDLLWLLKKRAEDQESTEVQREVAWSVYRMVANCQRMITYAIGVTEHALGAD